MPVQMGSKSGPCKGKKFLVTGGARGIGKAIVTELYAQGATVYVLARNPEGLENLKKELPGAKTIAVDIADWNATRKAVENLEPLDGLINNAAISQAGNFMDITPEDMDRLYHTNLKSVVNISQVIGKKMIEAGKGGSIVNIASLAGKRPMPGAVAYSSLKAALIMLTKGMALEFAPHKIIVNSVCPGLVDTDAVRKEASREAGGASDAADQMAEFMKSKTPTNMAFMPMSDIVNTILFFGSNITTQITGENLLVDGGMKINF